MYLPEGFGTLFPYMILKDANRFIDFVRDVFGADEMGRSEMPDGRLANARIRIGTTAFMVSEAEGSVARPMPGSFYIYVEDVDRTHEKAIEHGCTALFEPADMSYDDRQSGVSDPFGNHWWISKRLVEKPYED